MMILARTSMEVILRDPRPTAGRRTVESKDEKIELRFMDVDMRISKPASNGRATLTMRVPELDLATHRLWPINPPWPASDFSLPILFLINFNRHAVNLQCGRSFGSPLMEAEEFKSVRITGDNMRDGAFVFTCPVRFRKPAPANIDIEILEAPPFASRGHLPLPFPR